MTKLMKWGMFALILGLLIPMAADAKIRMRSGDSKQRLVKVQELPDIPQLLHQSGKYMDLGYFWKRDKDGVWQGDWVGYLGTSSYLVLSRSQLRNVMGWTNLGVLPLPPPKPKASFRESWLFYLLAGMALLVVLYRTIAQFRERRRLKAVLVEAQSLQHQMKVAAAQARSDPPLARRPPD